MYIFFIVFDMYQIVLFNRLVPCHLKLREKQSNYSEITAQSFSEYILITVDHAMKYILHMNKMQLFFYENQLRRRK